MKKIGVRILALIALLFIFNAFYTHFIWPDELAKEGPELKKLVRISDSCDVLYFGESSNISYDPVNDTNHSSISSILAQLLPNLIIGDITHQAYHAGIYLPLIRRIPANSKVKTIVVTLNLRTLGQACIHSGLETALQKQALYYTDQAPILIHLRAALNHYDHVSAYERDFEMWKQWTRDTIKLKGIKFPFPTIKSWCAAEKYVQANGIEDMEKRTLADHYIKAYAFVIKNSNPRVLDLDEIANVCKTKNISLIFNLLAENTSYADSLAGSCLAQLIRANRNFLVKRYTSLGAKVVDNLEMVDPEAFTDKNWTTEHYNFNGRQCIASNLSKFLIKPKR